MSLLVRLVMPVVAMAAACAVACSSSTPAPAGARGSSGSSGDGDGDGDGGGGGAGTSSKTDGGAGASDGSTVPQTNGFPAKWIDGTACAAEPDVQVWKYAEGTFIFRQSLCTNFEGPFVYLFVGATKALLVDTGTGAVDLRPHVMTALAGKSVDLVVAHSHGHGDHVGGDGPFKNQPKTTVVGTGAAAARQFFGVTGDAAASFDLGGRVVDVLAIPGHQAAHLAFYDRDTRVLLTGDTLYPGRLYIDDWNAYRTSVARLVAFVDAGRPVSFVLGAHIEMPKTGDDYAMGAQQHPNEHVLQLGDAELRELEVAVKAMGATPKREVHTHFIVSP